MMQQQLADEDIEEETSGERRRPRQLFENVDQRQEANGLVTWRKCLSPFCRIPTIQVMKKTISASGTVVFRSAVGEPPKGSPAP